MAHNITDSNLNEFIKLVRRAVFLNSDEEQYFKAIPKQKWKEIFAVNFDGTLNYAQRVILNKYKEIERIDDPRVDRYKLQIHNLDKATKMMNTAINEKNPILIITDFDNDGSLAQSITNEFLKADEEAAKTIHMEYAQTVNGNSNRGFTVDLVEKMVDYYGISHDAKFLVVTADNGINSVDEQKKIHAQFPNAQILVTDHHNPEPDMVIQENNKAVIFNPHYNPTEFFKQFNISGASTIGVLLKNLLNVRHPEKTEALAQTFENINKLSKVSNLLDYVNTHPADKPEKDYIITRFLKLQPLLNINNSISKIITGEIPTAAIKAIEKKIPTLDNAILLKEAENIHIQNDIAKILLKIYADHKGNEKLDSSDFNVIFVSELNKAENYTTNDNINPNYIEQLRPLIFSLSADDNNTAFLSTLNDKMIGVFESIKVSEKTMANELRAGEVITKVKLDNSTIAYTDPHILSVFNRKFLNKVYNDENPGFALTLDSIGRAKVSGSFRSLYDISDILSEKETLEKMLNVKIETPGHERAAGFIVKSLDPDNQPIDENTIQTINTFINDSITNIKKNEVNAETEYLLTDLQAITLIDRINTVVRGNVSNFERITPLLKITPDTIWTDSYSTKQYTMEEIIADRKYGYITVNINFHGDTVIVPVELVRKIVDNDYKDYLSLGYMDGGVFMAEKVLAEENAKQVIDLRQPNHKQKSIIDVFEKDFKDKNYVNLTREQIKDNPFFKYHDYGQLNFDLFERMILDIIKTNNIDTLSVFDVEANGFGNSKLMNFGAMNYTVNESSGTEMKGTEFLRGFYSTMRGEDYLLTAEERKGLKKVTAEQKEKLPLTEQKMLLRKGVMGEDYVYYKVPESAKTKDGYKYQPIRNFDLNEESNTYKYNREIQATMLAYLVNDNDFKVPQEMTNLTGITQDILTKYGKPTDVVDKELANYYKGQKILFGAHNTPYDARVMRANTPEFYNVLLDQQLYDSALFSRQLKLCYDDVQVSNFKFVKGLPSNIYFYNNPYSEFNLSKFLEKNENGYYPDRANNYLLEIDNGNYYLVDKKKHEKVKLVLEETPEEKKGKEQAELTGFLNGDIDYDLVEQEIIGEGDALPVATEDEQKAMLTGLAARMITGALPNTAVKYSVEKLSEQWMIHSLLLSDEKFDIKHVDLSNYVFLPEHAEALSFFQDNYHFDTSFEENIMSFRKTYDFGFDADTTESEEVKKFQTEFLELNKLIQQKFSDSWMYKQVLEIKDPTKMEVTKDLIDLVNFQTSIPKDKIRTIFEEAIQFKEKHKIKHVLQHEGHVNGPWEGDSKGDVAFEDKLTLSLLAQRKYNSYTHTVDHAVAEFNRFKVDARRAFELADNLSDSLAQDSYSYRQGLGYEREAITDMIANIQEKEKKLSSNVEAQIVKFKLDNDVLPQDSGVYAITRKNIDITRENIEEDSKKLSFIFATEQVVSSMENIEGSTFLEANINAKTTTEYVANILLANQEKSLQYKAELAQRYQYIEFNRRDFQIKNLLKASMEGLESPKKIATACKIDKVNYIDAKGLHIVQEIFNRYCDNHPLYSQVDDADVKIRRDSVNLVLEQMKNKFETTLTKAVNQTEPITFDNLTELREGNFFSAVPVKRENPLGRLLDSYPNLRLINEFVLQAKERLTNDKQISSRLDDEDIGDFKPVM